MSSIGDQVQHFTGGAATAVDAQAIERELAALWRASSEGQEAVTRACLWNLIVRTEGAAELERARQLMDRIAPAVPARVLLLGHEPAGQGPEVEAWVSANCQIAPGGGKLLCSEEIMVATRGAGGLHLAPLVQALMVPDVPAALLWLGGVPADPPLLGRLSRGAERMIVDSAESRGDGALAALARASEAIRPCTTIDLAWLRLAPMRILFASFFDPPVGAAPLSTAVRLTFETAERGVRGAALIAGWLSSRLGWGRFVAAGAGRWRAAREGGEVAIELTVRDGDAGRDGIFRVALDGADGASFAITDAGPEAIQLTGTGLPERVLAAPERSDPELVVAALGGRGIDPLFRDALARAAELVPG